MAAGPWRSFAACTLPSLLRPHIIALATLCHPTAGISLLVQVAQGAPSSS